MKFFSLAALASLAAAAPGVVPSSPLDVKLEMQDNSVVKAVVTNAGSESVKVVKTGSILDNRRTQKADVSNSNGNVAFEGIRMYLSREADKLEYQEISSGQSVEVTFDVAELYNLSKGGKFDIQSIGDMQVNKDGKLQTVSFASNKINTHVDGAAAAKAFSQVAKRSTIHDDCNASQTSALESAHTNTHDIAVAAAEAARSGPAKKMEEYFESASSSARNTVAAAFDKMAKLYSTNSGKPDIYCSDIGNDCQGGVVAYTQPQSNYIVFCPAWFQYPTLNKSCRQVDQAHISVHESTHLSLTKGTSDYGTYGYEDSIALPASKNLNHADTYAYFAHDTLSGC